MPNNDSHQHVVKTSAQWNDRAVEYWVAPIQPGRVLFEIGGISEEVAREAFRLAAAKLSVTTSFVRKQVI